MLKADEAHTQSHRYRGHQFASHVAGSKFFVWPTLIFACACFVGVVPDSSADRACGSTFRPSRSVVIRRCDGVLFASAIQVDQRGSQLWPLRSVSSGPSGWTWL
jgi:hypothetical protein